MPIMAYSPIEQGRLLSHPTLQAIALDRGVTAAQVAIAWLLHQDNVIVIPKSSRIDHVEDNRAALDLKLSAVELTTLDQAFPTPSQPVPLEML
jgi:diketogulonate reductase-like aldo/keto reductase